MIRLAPQWPIQMVVVLTLAILPSKLKADEALIQAERARATVAMKLHLMATDILDELVYRWTSKPPLAKPSEVVIMAITSPMGLNQQFTAFLENHFHRLVIQNPKSNVIPVYCGTCSTLTAFASPRGTIIAPGAAIADLKGDDLAASFALYLDFSIEKSQLLLRSRLVALDDHRRIIHAETIATDSGQPPSLRLPGRLASLEQVRKEYVEILTQQERTRLALGTKVMMIDLKDELVLIPPIPWLLVGLDVYPSDQRQWYMNLSLGMASIPEEVNGTLVQGRYARHIYPEHSNLIQPDIYGFFSLEYFELKGRLGRALIGSGKDTPGEFRQSILDDDPSRIDQFSTASLSIGAEVHLARMSRIGVFVGRMMQVRTNEIFPDSFHFYGFDLAVSL